MTYKELKAHIEVMDEEQVNTDVTVYVTGVDEYYPLHGTELDFSPFDDVLDKNHPFLIV
jgi:hypothetical protein